MRVFDAGGAAERRFERRVQLGERRLRQESQAAEVDAEDRDVDVRGAGAVGDRQERAVASEHDEQVHAGDQRRLVGHVAPGRRRHERGGRRLEHGLVPARGQPRFDGDEMRRRLAQMRFRDDADTGDDGTRAHGIYTITEDTTDTKRQGICAKRCGPQTARRQLPPRRA